MYVLGLAFSFDGTPHPTPLPSSAHPCPLRPDLHKVRPLTHAKSLSRSRTSSALQAPPVRLLAHARLLGRRLGDDGLPPHRRVRSPRRGHRQLGSAERDLPPARVPVPQLRRAPHLVSVCVYGGVRMLSAECVRGGFCRMSECEWARSGVVLLNFAQRLYRSSTDFSASTGLLFPPRQYAD